MTKETSPTRRGIRETYDRIASHFAKTRPRPWSEVEDFLEGREGDIGLDIGIGNGRHAALLDEHCRSVVGLDASLAIIHEAEIRAQREGFTVWLLLGDAVELPMCDDIVDLSTYVATLHHLPTRKTRIQSLNELARVLSLSGRAIVSVWSVTHDRFDAQTGFDTTVDWTLMNGEIVERFYHIYDLTEFEAEVNESNLELISLFESAGNCYAIVRSEE